MDSQVKENMKEVLEFFDLITRYKSEIDSEIKSVKKRVIELLDDSKKLDFQLAKIKKVFNHQMVEGFLAGKVDFVEIGEFLRDKFRKEDS